jgi:3-dehydroquinate synthase
MHTEDRHHRNKVRVPLPRTIDESYDIEIGEDLFDQIPRDLRANILPGASRIAIITDGAVRLRYGERILVRLRSEGIDAAIFDFAPGEKHKTRETKAALEDALIASRFGRDSGVIALGGGVVSDLAGFVAGTFARGIPFLIYSTTVLGAADASVGGKTAVDTPVATNLIGLFHQPRKVYIDTATWGTLPPAEIRNGLAETVKHACLGDHGFFEYLEQHLDQLLPAVTNGGAIDPAVATHIAVKNCEIKSCIVAADVHETNFRQVLNLGHTLGRALEPLANFSLSHGEAVAIGLVFQLRLGKRFGYVTGEEVARVEGLIARIGLPTRIPATISAAPIVEKMHTDKKARRDVIRFVFQESIGKMVRFPDGNWSRAVAEDELVTALVESYS